MNTAFQELLEIRNRADMPTVKITGSDPVYSSRFKIAETGAAVLAATGVAISDIWEMKTGRPQDVSVDVRHAAAALNSVAHLMLRQPDGAYKVYGDSPLAQMAYDTIRAYPTKDGRWFMPHFGMKQLKERVLEILDCEQTQESIAKAVAKWDAEDLDQTIAAANACGGIARTEEEWRNHPHGRALAAQAVVEIEKIGDSAPEPFPEGGPALQGVRVLDLTRILAGPVAARTMAEHGADVLMVSAPHVPQIKKFVLELSHGKRSCFLDLNTPEEAARLKDLVRGADVFSQGYRPGVLEARGFGPEELARERPGLVYTSINCYGSGGPLSNRGGWEQIAQTVTGISQEVGNPPELLPVYFCDYSTGYLGAYGTLLALARRAVEGGSYHVRVSLCRSAMFLQDQGRIDYPSEGMGIPDEEARSLQMDSETTYGQVRHLGPVIRFSESTPGWSWPSPALGADKAEWLPRDMAR
ncbi:CoA transferase [uncultured Sneathiella sp.]|uniref:CoA transferase n=1 Tax=uncultured Sneathiella sp. TaxID=879315 RepID=UPI0030DDA190|tara:strand:- start:6274 stop:7680 length:1407 start_codon:yes stop_codon:yes gene_type:complete